MLIIADETEQIRELTSGLAQSGVDCSITPCSEDSVEQVMEQEPSLVFIDLTSPSANLNMPSLLRSIKQESHLPVIALITRETLGLLDPSLGIDDFAVAHWDPTEVAARAKRALWRTKSIDSSELIKAGDLVIDLGKCEVSIDGILVALTFKEYELLRTLVSNKGRVFTRDALLNKIWGDDYFGGDRTVDVHIRRLRSKIEDPTHTFIETVRNIGYRFKEE